MSKIILFKADIIEKVTGVYVNINKALYYHT